MRIQVGENNIKENLFLCAALGRMEALEKNLDPEKYVVDAALVSARNSLQLLYSTIKIQETVSETNLLLDVGRDMLRDVSMLDQFVSYGFVMQDATHDPDFDLPESWQLFGWGGNNEWRF